MRYKAQFIGRCSGAVGSLSSIRTEVVGLNKEDARANLYDKYEHISNLTLTEIKEGVNNGK